MRVDFQERGNKSVAFGYDKFLNMQLASLLRKNNTDLNTSLLKLNTFCNDSEDIIDLAQKTKSNDINQLDNLDRLIEFFIDLKTTLMRHVEDLFPNLKFATNEVKNYSSESMQPEKEWKTSILESLIPKNNQEFLFNAFEKNADSPNGLQDIPGRENLKASIKNEIIDPLLDKSIAKRNKEEYGNDIPGSLILEGVPGCNKPMMAEAIAREAKLPFYKLDINQQLFDPLEDNTTIIEKIFESLSNSYKKTNKPSVLYLNDIQYLYIDSNVLAPESKILFDLMKSAKNNGILILASIDTIGKSNTHSLIKKAFDLSFKIGLPDKEGIKSILKKELSKGTKGTKGAVLSQSEKDLSEIASKLEGAPDLLIKSICKNAAILAKNDGRRDIQKSDYLDLIAKNIKPKNNKKFGYNK